MKHAVALGLALGLLAYGSAFAQATKTYAEPNGRFTLNYPAKWPADLMSKTGDVDSQIVVGGADAECWFYGFDRPEWASARPTDVRRTFKEPFSESKLIDSFSGRLLSTGDNSVPKLVTSSVETVNGWPVQFGEIQAGATKLMVSVQARPGFEVRTVCKAYDAKDHSADFRAVTLSLTSPRDAEWEAQAQEWEAKKAAAETEANAKSAAAAPKTPPAGDPAKPGKKRGKIASPVGEP